MLAGGSASWLYVAVAPDSGPGSSSMNIFLVVSIMSCPTISRAPLSSKGSQGEIGKPLGLAG
jgi:hypothetical protein